MSDFFTSLLARAQERAPVLHWRRPALFESAPLQAGPGPEPQTSAEPPVVRPLTAVHAAPVTMALRPAPREAEPAAPLPHTALPNNGPLTITPAPAPASVPILAMPAPNPAWPAAAPPPAEAMPGATTLIERHEIHHQHYHLQRAADLATIRNPGPSAAAPDSKQEAGLAAWRMANNPPLADASDQSKDSRLSTLQAEQEAQAHSLEQGMREIQSARRAAEHSAAQAGMLAASSARSNSLRPKPGSASADAALLAQAALAGLARQSGQRGVGAPGGTAPAAPTVQVHIGRIEVRAHNPAPAGGQATARRTHTPQMSLDDYLRQRTEKR